MATPNGVFITIMPSTAITTAVTGSTTTPVACGVDGPTSISWQAVLTYGSGGTTVKAWLQTSLDGGATWFDIANFAATTAALIKVGSVTTAIAPGTNPATPTDGSLADNTTNNGIIGPMLRVKYTTTGTYAATTLAITGYVRR
jgi:hypothetical protein